MFACKVRVCEFNAKTTHPVRFLWNQAEIHRTSASGLVIVTDRVRQETMMIRHCPKMDRCCPPPPPQSNPSIPLLSLLPGPEQITAAGPQAGRGTNPRGSSRNGDAPLQPRKCGHKGADTPLVCG